MKINKYLYLFALIAMVIMACADDEDGLILGDDDIVIPQNVTSTFDVSNDNSGTVTVTPSAQDATSFEVLFGDVVDEVPTEVAVGESVEHVYPEGNFILTITAINVTGGRASITQDIVITFAPPENLQLAVEQSGLDVTLTPTADGAAQFDVFFGELENDTAVVIMPGESAMHTYQEIGQYEIRTIARGAGAATLDSTIVVDISNPFLSLPIDFSTENQTFSTFNGASFEIITDPDDENNQVGQLVNSGVAFEGAALDIADSVSFAANKIISMRFFSTTENNDILLKFENGTENAVEVVSSVAASGWSDVTFDFSNANFSFPESGATDATGKYKTVVIFVNGPATDAGTFLFDDINQPSSFGDTPLVAAPAPTQDASNVISMFSNVFTDVTVDTWRTDWSDATFEDVQIAGDDTKKYTDLNFVGIETTSTPIDATSMTHFSFDLWTPNSTQFRVKLVDFGPDGGFGGGDDTEHELAFDNPTPGSWVSYDIPLSDFTGLTTQGSIQQLIYSSDPSGTSTAFIDNIYFYQEGMPAMEPSVAAPAPTQDASNVISMFSNAFTDVTVDTWRTDWSDATFEDVQIAGDDTKKYTDLNFVGIETTSMPIDATSMTHFSFDLWTPNSTQFRVKLVDFGPDGGFGGGDDTEHELAFDNPTPGSWVSYDIPLSDFTGLTTQGSIQQLIYSSDPSGTSTAFIDNIYFYQEGMSAMEPSVAAPMPTQDASNVISMFSNVFTDVTVDTWRTDWSDATFEDVQIAGDDTKKYTDLNFVGIETTSMPIDATSMTHFSFDLWTPNSTQFRVKLVDFGPDGGFGGGDDTEHELAFDNPTPGSWVSYDIPLSDFTGLTTQGSIQQLIYSSDPSGTSTAFIDNIYFYQEGMSAMEPSVAAPMPTQDASNVISMFSNVFTDVTVDTWRTDWSDATFEDVQIAGDDTKKYTDLNFVGIETTSMPIDATSMTHFSFDLWTPNSSEFRVKLVDFGPDGAFGGGDDTEHELGFDTPSPGTWVSYDIPLSDFTGLTTKGSIQQLIYSSDPSGTSTAFIDNIYFYQEGMSAMEPSVAAPTPTEPSANVISMFSNAYTDVTVDTWRTDWSDATFADVQIAGNDTKRYTDLNFVGIETTSMPIDATSMTHFSFDLWTPNSSEFRVKLVDFGPDGAFGGGDDTEHELAFDTPSPGTWVSYDIPLSDFTGLTTKGSIQQLIFSSDPSGASTAFIDNIYFYSN